MWGWKLPQAAKICPASIYVAGAKLWRLVSASWDDLCDQEHLWREIQMHIVSVGYSLPKKYPYFYLYDKKPVLKKSRLSQKCLLMLVNKPTLPRGYFLIFTPLKTQLFEGLGWGEGVLLIAPYNLAMNLHQSETWLWRNVGPVSVVRQCLSVRRIYVTGDELDLGYYFLRIS